MAADFQTWDDVTEADVFRLAAFMRPPDRAEIEASRGPNHYATVKDAVDRSVWCKAMSVDGAFAGLFGVTDGGDLLNPVGVPWMLGTPALRPSVIVSKSPGFLRHMLSLFPKLKNYVDARNTPSLRYLKHLGFDIHPAVPHGKMALPFHPFTIGF